MALEFLVAFFVGSIALEFLVAFSVGSFFFFQIEFKREFCTEIHTIFDNIFYRLNSMHGSAEQAR